VQNILKIGQDSKHKDGYGIWWLDERMKINGGWIGGEIELLRDWVAEIRDICQAYEKETKPNLQHLKEIYGKCCKAYNNMYAAAYGIMNDDKGANEIKDIVNFCAEIKKHGNCLQSSTQIVSVYADARQVKKSFHEALKKLSKQKMEVRQKVHDDKAHDDYLVEVVPGPLKRLPRLIEKMLSREIECAGILDLVRAMVVCENNEEILYVLKELQNSVDFTVHKVKEGYSDYEHGNWVDVKVIVSMKSDTKMHKCEIQIVHKLMRIAREDMGGHHAYSKFRSLAETIKKLEEESEEDILKVEEYILRIMNRRNSKHVSRLAKCFQHALAIEFERSAKIESEIGHLESQLPELMHSRKFAACQQIQNKIDSLRDLFDKEAAMESAFGPALRMLPPGEQEGDTSFLALYPSIPLDEYQNTGDFWFIDVHYPGLQAISRDPWIFLVPNMLTLNQCRALVMKGGPHMVQSKSFDPITKKFRVSADRTSWEVRIPYNEVPAIQALFSKVLRMPVENLEPLKLVRYQKDECFKSHHDAKDPNDRGSASCEVPYSNRVVAMFVYLNTPESGGETEFTRCGLKVKPRAGMGVIHFPAYLNTSSYRGPEKGAPYTSIKVGTKVQGKHTPGAKNGEAGCAICMGTVTELTDRGTVKVLMDYWGGINEYDISKAGNLSLTLTLTLTSQP
jgi:hypothetical protein